MNYPGNAKKNYNKFTSYSNRGMDLETLIDESNKYYLDNNIAIIYKKPTPIQIVDTKYENTSKLITKAFFKSPSTLDYNGIYKGKYIDFDAKVTKNKTSFPLQNLHDHQYEHMKKIIEHGGISFLIISINNQFYLLDGFDIIKFRENNIRKSIPLSFIQEYGYLIKTKIRPFLDYIEIVDKIFFKEDE